MSNNSKFLNADISWKLTKISEILYQNARDVFPEFSFKKIYNGWEASKSSLNGDKAAGHVYLYKDKPSTFIDQKSGQNISV